MNKDLIIPVVEIVDQKRGLDKEVLVILFERCNLKCTFCHQNHDNLDGVGEILKHGESILANYDGVSNYKVNITGGELFLDEHPDQVFEDYYQLAKMLHANIERLELTFVTNMIFSNVERVRTLLERLASEGMDVRLATSYDPVGRFNGTLRKVFKDNYDTLLEYIRVVNVVLTKDCVKYFTSGRTDPLFDYIYQSNVLYFDNYTPRVFQDTLLPNNAQVVDFYLYMSDNYPEIQPLKSWTMGFGSVTTCRKTMVTNPGGMASSCRSLPVDGRVEGYIAGEVVRRQSEISYVEKYKCLECEYYSRCGLSCFLSHEYKGDDSVECHYKRLFKKLTMDVI